MNVWFWFRYEILVVKLKLEKLRTARLILLDKVKPQLIGKLEFDELQCDGILHVEFEDQ